MTSTTDFVRTISRQEIAGLPIARYAGPICLPESPRDVELAMADIRKESVVGFDTETRPSFVKGQSHLPCLVQIATARAVYLFQLRRRDFSTVLTEILESPRIVKSGISLADDIRQLKQLFTFEQAGVLDPGIVANRNGLAQTGLRNLAGIFLGFRIPKGTRTSNWAVQHLSAAQINYAATDAWACRELYLCFERLGLIGTPPTR